MELVQKKNNDLSTYALSVLRMKCIFNLLLIYFKEIKTFYVQDSQLRTTTMKF